MLGLALLGGGIGTVRADAAPPPADALEGATAEQHACITRNDGTKRAAVSAWRRPEPRYKAYRAVLDAAYRRVTGSGYHYNAPIAGVPFGLLGHGLDEKTGRVILLVDPELIDPVSYATFLDRVARRSNLSRKVPAGQEISVTLQPGCFTAKQIENLRDRMRSHEGRGDCLVQRVGRDVEFDGRLHVLVHVDDRESFEKIRRGEGPMLDVYWTTEGRSAREYQAWAHQRRLLEPPRTPDPEDDLSDATPAQYACITRNDRFRKVNSEHGGWWGDLDRRYYAERRITRAAYEVAAGARSSQVRGRDDPRIGLLGYVRDDAHNRVIYHVDPERIDPVAFTRALEGVARRANRDLNVPPGQDVRVLVQPSCFTAEEMIDVRERLRRLPPPGRLTRVEPFIRWDGRLYVWIHPDGRWFRQAEELRRREGPIIRVGYAPPVQSRDL